MKFFPEIFPHSIWIAWDLTGWHCGIASVWRGWSGFSGPRSSFCSEALVNLNILVNSSMNKVMPV